MRSRYTVSFEAPAARQVQRERTWLHNHRGADRADAFEAELRRTLELLSDHPEMGYPSDEGEDERRTFLRGSRLHVFYLLDRERQAIRVVRLRHERQGR